MATVPTLSKGSQRLYRLAQDADPIRVRVVESYVAGGGYQGADDANWVSIVRSDNGAPMGEIKAHDLDGISHPLPEDIELGAWFQLPAEGKAFEGSKVQITAYGWKTPDDDPVNDHLVLQVRQPIKFDTALAEEVVAFDSDTMTRITDDAEIAKLNRRIWNAEDAQNPEAAFKRRNEAIAEIVDQLQPWRSDQQMLFAGIDEYIKSILVNYPAQTSLMEIAQEVALEVQAMLEEDERMKPASELNGDLETISEAVQGFSINPNSVSFTPDDPDVQKFLVAAQALRGRLNGAFQGVVDSRTQHQKAFYEIFSGWLEAKEAGRIPEGDPEFERFSHGLPDSFPV